MQANQKNEKPSTVKAGRDMQTILTERGRPVEVGGDGTVHFFDIDRETGLPIAKKGSELNSYTREDGVTVREHSFTRADGTKVLLGTDYGAPAEYLKNQPDGVGGDPLNSLRRQVALSSENADLAAKYIDTGSGQVDPAKWKDFLGEAQDRGLRMMGASNGLDTAYQPALDNARILAGQADTIAINVYNPTGGSIARDLPEAILGQFGQKQSVQVAIQNQMQEAITYNEGMIAVQAKLGNTVAPFLTDFVGHSQGSINGNAAIGRMTDIQQESIRVINVE